MSDQQPAAPEAVSPKKRSPAAKWRDIVMAVVAVALIGWVAVEAVVGKSDDGENAVDSERGFEAKAICQEYVKARLKSPGSAKFSKETPTMSGASVWTVTGIVDSQNSFGGLVRNGYRCVATATTGGNWELRSLDLDGN